MLLFEGAVGQTVLFAVLGSYMIKVEALKLCWKVYSSVIQSNWLLSRRDWNQCCYILSSFIILIFQPYLHISVSVMRGHLFQTCVLNCIQCFRCQKFWNFNIIMHWALSVMIVVRVVIMTCRIWDMNHGGSHPPTDKRYIIFVDEKGLGIKN